MTTEQEIKDKMHFSRKDMFKEEPTFGLIDHWNERANARIDKAIHEAYEANQQKSYNAGYAQGKFDKQIEMAVFKMQQIKKEVKAQTAQAILQSAREEARRYSGMVKLALEAWIRNEQCRSPQSHTL